jgi:hypothetical protein
LILSNKSRCPMKAIIFTVLIRVLTRSDLEKKSILRCCITES